MTVAQITDRARRLSRTTASGASDSVILDSINEAQKDFVKRCFGLEKEEYLVVAPKFFITTDMAINLTITGSTNNDIAATDITITGTDAEDQTGAQVATALQAQIRTAIGGSPDLTVTFSSSTWKFTVDGIDSTAIAVSAPVSTIEYVDATELLGLSGSGTDSLVGSIPQDSTIETDLPSDWMMIKTNPEWNDNPLYQIPHEYVSSPETFGTPVAYYITNDEKIRLFPAPNKQGRFRVWYYYMPTNFTTVQGYQECGLTGKTGTTATGLSTTTQYYFKVIADGAYQEEIDITTASDVTYSAVIALINTALAASTNSTVVTASLESGDLRFTSSTTGTTSSVSLAAGTTGTDLFATLTDFSAFETAVASDSGTELTLPDDYHMAIAYHVAHELAQQNFEYSISDRMMAEYLRLTGDYIKIKANESSRIFPSAYVGTLPQVNMPD